MGQSSSNLPQYPDLEADKFPIEEGSKVQLKDGRYIGYKEFGHPNGKYIIFLFHGFPGSRLFCHPDNENAKELNVKIITIERPGFGLSSPHPGRTFLSWADDVAEFADLLHIEKFSIIAYSSGGPFGLSCLYKIPQRIISAAIVSSICPREVPDITKEMPTQFKLAWWLAGNMPSSLKSIVKMTASDFLKNPVKTGRNDWSNYHQVDFETYTSTPEIEKRFIESGLEIYKRKQWVSESEEYALWGKPWGYQLKDIKCKNVTVYQGKLDRGTTFQMGSYIHSQIEGSKSVFPDNKGHLFFFEAWHEMINTAIECANNLDETNKTLKEEEKKEKIEDKESKEEKKEEKEQIKEEIKQQKGEKEQVKEEQKEEKKRINHYWCNTISSASASEWNSSSFFFRGVSPWTPALRRRSSSASV